MPTPPRVDGGADLTAIEHTVAAIRDQLAPGAVLVTGSTVPVGTAAKLRTLLGRPDVRGRLPARTPSGPGTDSSSGRACPTTVSAVSTDTTTSDTVQLRAALADYIRGRKTFRTSRVEDAFRTVPRHVFLPGVDLETAYAPRPVVTKRADDGTTVSSASSPNLVAEMLELLDVQPGHRVLEIGAATGINAALLAELAGPTGEVVTIELDDDLATGARDGLAVAGYHKVEVICGDGALGHPSSAPYDGIIVTAGHGTSPPRGGTSSPSEAGWSSRCACTAAA